MSDDNLLQIQELLDSAMSSLKTAHALIREETGIMDTTRERHQTRASSMSGTSVSGRVVEGIFDGQNMVGQDNKQYPVPANYASKSKLVQGDELKLTIGDDGAFLYKQIGPVPRRKIIGTLNLKDGQYYVEAQGTDYRVLFASVTYYKAQPGDQVTIVIPEDGPSEWAAIEAVIV